MINSIEDIRCVFNIFHDGDIIEYESSNNELKLKVKISYLTERIRDGFSYFSVTLFDCTNIKLETWPNQKDHEPEVFQDLRQIFQATLLILDAETKDNSIVVSCNQSDAAFNYCGGFLSFTAKSAKVIDETGKEYTIDELGKLSDSYWDEWESKNKV